ncbi:hypothetical protein Tco_0529742 [Tanacetum coccineum]
METCFHLCHVGQHWEKRLCWIEHSTFRLTSRGRDLKSVYMESRHFRNDLYASQFQQSGSVTTEGTRTNCFYASQSSSMAHKQFLTTHHLNTDPDAEQQGFLRATGTSPLHILCQHQLYKTLMSIGLQSLKITLSTLPLRDINAVSHSFLLALTSVSRKELLVKAYKSLEDCYSSSSLSLLMIQAVDLREDASCMLG